MMRFTHSPSKLTEPFETANKSKPQGLQIHIHQSLNHFNLDINTAIESNGLTAIYGHSGAGKTSFLRLIAGFDKRPHNEVFFNQTCWQSGKHFTPCHQRQVGYVFQDAQLFSHLSVEQNLDYSRKRSAKQQTELIDYEELIGLLELKPLLKRSPDKLSGGERQRVAIARTLLNKPQLLLLDEPLAAVDAKAKQRILNYFIQLKPKLNIPIIYVSHSLQEISQLADQLIHLEQGRIVQQGEALSLIPQIQWQQSMQTKTQALDIAPIFTPLNGIVKTEQAYPGIHILDVEGTYLKVPSKRQETAGKSLRLLLFAKDISLSLSAANDSSILNIIPASIEQISQQSDGSALIELQVKKFCLYATITQYSLEQLQLEIGQNVFAQIKAVSIIG